MSEKVPIIVVLGIDVDDKPHASRFEERDAPFVLRAAEMQPPMTFHIFFDDSGAHGTLVASSIAQKNLSSSASAFPTSPPQVIANVFGRVL